MPDYPLSDNMYSTLEDPDVEEEQPLEYPYQMSSGPTGENRYTPRRTHGYGYNVGALEDYDAYQHHQHREEDVLSPTDGYFGRSGSAPSTTSSAYPSGPYSTSSQIQVHGVASTSQSTPGYAAAASAQVPHVPDVWVSDPTIEQGSTAESKAREAREERESDSRRRGGQPGYASSQQPPASRAGAGAAGPSAFTYATSQQSSSSSSGPGHPRYGYGPGLRYTPPPSSTVLSCPQRSGTIYSERSSLFSEAPPAYTPSPTSPTGASSSHDSSNNYQTFSPPSNMGRIPESESQGLLAGHQQQYYRSPQDMGGERGEDGYSSLPRVGGWRKRATGCVPHSRSCKLFFHGLVLLFVAVGFLVSSFVSVEDEVSCSDIPMLKRIEPRHIVCTIV